VHSSHGGIRTVIVDDHGVLRDSLGQFLGGHDGIDIVGAVANGRELLALLPDRVVDVVLMDLSMPELNGIDATRELLLDYPAVKVIALTMFGDIEHIQGAIAAGVLGYMLKDSVAEEVVNAVRVVHSGCPYYCQQVAAVMSSALVKNGKNGNRKGGNGNGHGAFGRLSSRETEVLQLIAEGKNTKEIAHLLSISPKTVETHRARLMQKTKIHDIPGLVKLAVRHGLTPLGA
jgi:DNA-binding NarL/FixJ family response regulator